MPTLYTHFVDVVVRRQGPVPLLQVLRTCPVKVVLPVPVFEEFHLVVVEFAVDEEVLFGKIRVGPLDDRHVVKLRPKPVENGGRTRQRMRIDRHDDVPEPEGVVMVRQPFRQFVLLNQNMTKKWRIQVDG